MFYAQIFDAGTGDFNMRTIAELNSTCPSVPWLNIINILIHPIKYNDGNEIIVICPDCMIDIHQLLERTPKR